MLVVNDVVVIPAVMPIGTIEYKLIRTHVSNAAPDANASNLFHSSAPHPH